MDSIGPIILAHWHFLYLGATDNAQVIEIMQSQYGTQGIDAIPHGVT